MAGRPESGSAPPGGRRPRRRGQAFFGVAPEVQRHRRHRLGAHQLADLVDQRPADAVLVGLGPGFDARAQAAALHLAFDHRQRGQPTDEGPGEVGAAADRREPDVLAVHLGQLVPDPAVALGRQRRAGGTHRAQRRQIGHGLRFDPGLQARGKEGRTGAEEGAARQSGKAPQRGPVRRAMRPGRAAVEDADGGAAQQHADLAVPHDPAGARIPMEAVAAHHARADIVVQRAHLQRLDHDAAMAVHDGLGQPGGAAGIDHPQRVVEGQPGGSERCIAGQRGGQVVRLAAGPGQVHIEAEVAPQQHMAHAGQLGEQLREQLAPVVRGAGVAVAVAGHQQLGFDLAEAVEHRHRPHVGRAHRPDRPQAGAGQEGDDGLRHVGHDRTDPVAALHPHGLERGRAGSHLAAQFGPAHFTQFAARQQRLVAEHDRRMAGRLAGLGMTEQVLHVVELRTGKPSRTGHHRLAQHARMRRG